MSKKVRKIKLSTNAKKIIILCSMVGLLVITGVLNFVLNDNVLLTKDPQSGTGNGDDAIATFYSTYRADREVQRAQELSYLDSIIKLEGASQETIASAESKKFDLIKQTEQELVLESLIKAKGFDDVVVTMSENNINVIVSATELVSSQVSQIVGVILQETTYTPSDIYVMTYSV